MIKIDEHQTDYLKFRHDCDKNGTVRIKKIEKDELKMNWEITFRCQSCGTEEKLKSKIDKS